MSFDTVVFKKSFEPLDSDFWRDVGFTRKKDGRLMRDGDRTRMTVHQRGYGGKDWLLAQASLPKIVHGHNAMLVNEQQAHEAASWLCGRVSSQTGLSFTLDGVKAFRIDYTRDYDIQEDRARAIALALLPADLPNFNRTNRKGDSVWFAQERDGQTVKEIEVYPKFTWAIDTHQPQDVIEASRGKLRLEVRLKRKGLDNIKGAIKPLDYLAQSISDAQLNEAAAMLDLQRIIDARNTDFQERLIVHACGQGSLGEQGLATFIELVRRHGKDFNRKTDFHYPRSTYYKRIDELKRLGMWDDLVAASKVQSSYE
jgi:hypothetical protein